MPNIILYLSGVQDLLTILIFNSLWCVGVFSITSEGYLLHFLQKPFISFKAIDNKLLQFIYKPLFGCLTCMASLHSFWYFLLADFELKDYLVYVVALAGLNTVVNRILN